MLTIRTDYMPAAHSSGAREAPGKPVYFVVHTAESGAPDPGDAEAVGRWFQSSASSGSTHYGLDTDSVQQYLADSVEAWGAPPLNDAGLHVEVAGTAAMTRAQWLAYPSLLENLAQLMAAKCKQYGIPLRLIGVSELVRLGTHPDSGVGVTTHANITAAWHQTTHTDPGAGFPLADVIARAVAINAPTTVWHGRWVLTHARDDKAAILKAHADSLGCAVRTPVTSKGTVSQIDAAAAGLPD